MTWQSDARELATLLALEHTPIGISRMDAAPEGAARAVHELPSACAYWRLGEQRLVFATAEDHKNCPIGMMVMGFEPPPAVANEAQILVGNMAELGYLDPAEVAHLPMLPGGHAGVLYGPAEQFPVQPEAVLLICTPSQAMVLSEALGEASLLPESGRPILGRPACSAISRAVLNSAAEMSLACKGARVLAELAPGEMLVAIPGAALEATVAALRAAVSANAGMEQHYQTRKRTFAAAG
jgi:uncharacterized protein (DUF169 family)